jgi:hypothetical protein
MSATIDPLTGEFKAGDSDDADLSTDREALGARHKRNVGYTTAGADEHDRKLLADGGHPKHFGGKSKPGHSASRIGHFNHSIIRSGVINGGGGVIG